MNMNPIKSIYKFNKEAGLLDAGYSDSLECSMSIEESLEGFDISGLAVQLDMDSTSNHKQVSRAIIAATVESEELSDVDRFDKHLDAIVINFGSIFKMDLSVGQALRGLERVMIQNMQKLNAGTDESGKLKKPKDFHPPEEFLQIILDERNK